MAFDKDKHLIKMGNRDYLEVKWRLVWFRDQHPAGEVSTELQNIEPPIVKATIKDENGKVLATGYGSASAGEKKVIWTGREIEKAETAAIGRALAHAGYGTQFTGDDEADNLADSTVERRATPARQQQPPLPTQQQQAARAELQRTEPLPPAAGEGTQTPPAKVERPYPADVLITKLQEMAQKSKAPAWKNQDAQVKAVRDYAIFSQNFISADLRHWVQGKAWGKESANDMTTQEIDAMEKWLKGDPEFVEKEASALRRMMTAESAQPDTDTAFAQV